MDDNFGGAYLDECDDWRNRYREAKDEAKREDLEWLHDEAERLTGDRWVPYPSPRLINIFRSATDEEKKQMIEKRRTHLFPSFLVGIADEDLENGNSTHS